MQSLGETELVAQLARIEAGDPGSFAMRDSASRLEGAALALDAHTGEVLAWIGGRDFETSEFDRVEQARRQVGSLVKPLLVASALERGFGILDVVSADTVPIPTDEGGWLPADHVQETRLPLRDALVRSSNRAAARLGVDLGLETLTQIGTRVGIAREIPALPSSSIGAFDASLLEMTAAYALFGNGGHVVEPYLIEWIEAPDGSELWRRSTPVEATRVITEAQAFVVLDAMRAVVDRGTGVAVRGTGYRGPAAGKTGTTNESRDAWFVGLTPEMVAGIWVGFDQPAEIVSGGGGGTLAAPAWGRWMEAVRRSGRPRSGAWIPPEGVERIRYDAVNGEVYSLACRDRSVSAGYHEAWVEVGRYPRGSCSGWRRGLLGRLWRAVVPRDGDREPGNRDR